MGKCVVIVEDHRLHALLLQKALSARLPGGALELFADGAVALVRLRRVAAPVPDLLVFDLDLPGCTGHELLQACAREQHLAGVPAVIVTASEVAADRERSLALGARGHIVKPVDADGYTRLAGQLADLIGVAPARRAG
jgi:CheY-like chemotaxis protein